MNKRQHARQNVTTEVIVAVPGNPPITMRTGNISERGVFLIADGCELPPEGTEIVVTLNELLDSTEPMAMKARVIHQSGHGIGIEFLGPVE